MTTFNVLSLDGGGIRGLVTTVLLERLVATPGLEEVLEKADLIAGTSTGGLLALGIAHGLSLAELRDLYVTKGQRIFDDSWPDDLVDLGKLRGADYQTGPLRQELKRLFGETTLGRLKKKVLIPSFDLDNGGPKDRAWKPKVFHNCLGEGSDVNQLVWKVGLYTSAAPTYFPSVDGFIDGGVYAGNPSMCALAQTQDTRYAPTPPMEQVRLFSLGTGTNLQFIAGATHDWGYVQWAKPLINLMLDGTAGIADYQCRQLLDKRYHRLAPVFPSDVSVPLDAVERIPYMIDFAAGVPLATTIDWLKRSW
jgi:patatin-like phospholipase/acyl hydrolase